MIDKATKQIKPNEGVQTLALTRSEYEIGYGGARGGGKRTKLSDYILTPTGFIQLKDLNLGDELCNPDGTIAKVIKLHPIVMEEQYILTFKDGATVTCCKDHLWYGNWRFDKSDPTKSWNNVNCLKTVQQIIEQTQKGKDKSALKKGHTKYFKVPLTDPVQFDSNLYGDKRTIDPYLLGLLLGDGCITGNKQIKITTGDGDIDEITAYLKDYKYSIVNFKKKNCKDIIFRGKSEKELRKNLENLNLLGTYSYSKYIPNEYKISSVKERLALLQGLLDSDGCIENKNGRCRIRYYSISKQLVEDVRWIARSLGLFTTLQLRKARERVKEGEKTYLCQPCYMLSIKSKDNSSLFRLKRKAENSSITNWNNSNTLIDIAINKEKVPMRCITVDNPNGLYITNDFIVTHNTFAGRLFLMRDYEHPLYRSLVVRKNHTDLVEWIDKTEQLYTQVIPSFRFKDNPPVGYFPNGGRIYTGHLKDDNAFEKYQGHEYHKMVIEELNQIESELNYVKLISSCRSTVEGLNPQVFTTFNPLGVGHSWTKKRFVDKCKFKTYAYKIWNPVLKTWLVRTRIFIPARVYDNPVLIANDPNYLASLQDIPDERLRRAWLDGDFDVFSGQFFGMLDSKVHWIPAFEVPKDWTIVAGMDYGNTSVVIFVAISPTGDYVVFNEWSSIGKSQPERVYSLRNFLEKNGLMEHEILADTNMFVRLKEFPNQKSPAAAFQEVGIKLRAVSKKAPPNLNKTFRVYANEFIQALLFWEANDIGEYVREPKLYFMEGKCPLLTETLPLLQVDEKNPEDIAEDDNDHCFVEDTLITVLGGEKRIKDITTDDYVLTRKGFRKVLKRIKRKPQIIEEYNLCGHKLVGTPNHPIITGRGDIALSDLIHSDTFHILDKKEYFIWKQLLIKELFLDDTQTVAIVRTEFTLSAIVRTLKKGLGICIGRYGNQNTEKSRKDIIFTTLTIIHLITKLRILSVRKNISTYLNTLKNGLLRIKSKLISICQTSEGLQPNGIEVPKEDYGIKNTERKRGKAKLKQKEIATTVEKNTKLHSQLVVNIADRTVEPNTTAIVYDLTIDDVHEYYANGVLVHNCYDALKYTILPKAHVIYNESQIKEIEMGFIELLNPF